MGDKHNIPVEHQKEIDNLLSITREAIVPITFIGEDKIEKDIDINSTFVDPYMYKLVGYIVEVPAMVNKIQNLDPRNFKGTSMARTYIRNSKEAYRVDVLNYILMNTRDLVYNTLVRFNVDVFSSGTNDSLTVPFALIERMDICKTINYVMQSITDRFDNPINAIFDANNNMSPESSRAFMTQYMNVVYSYLVTNIFDKYIVKLVESLYEANAFSTVYELLKVKCYGEEADSVNYDVSVQYSFVTSILREMMGQHLLNMRMCLSDIGNTALNMISISPIGFLNDKIIPHYDYNLSDDDDEE